MNDKQRDKPPRKRLARRPRQRRKLKIQTTVRVEENLLKLSQKRAEKKHRTVTDLIEEGLWFGILRDADVEVDDEIIRDQSLHPIIPKHIRKLTLPFWAYMLTRSSNSTRNAFCRMITSELLTFEQEDPLYQAKVQELAEAVKAHLEGRSEPGDGQNGDDGPATQNPRPAA